MKLEETMEINWISLNYLEEQITSSIWDLLFINEDKLPKKGKVKVTIEFM